MRKTIVAALAAAALAVPTAGVNATGIVVDREPEGCQALNPVQPTCTFTVTEDMEGPIAGAAGYGTWKVVVKRGKKTAATLKSGASGEPTATEFLYEKGDKVTVTAVSPGSGVTAGGD